MEDSSPTMAPSTWALAIPKHATIKQSAMYPDKSPVPLVAKSNYMGGGVYRHRELYGCI